MSGFAQLGMGYILYQASLHQKAFHFSFCCSLKVNAYKRCISDCVECNNGRIVCIFGKLVKGRYGGAGYAFLTFYIVI